MRGTRSGQSRHRAPAKRVHGSRRARDGALGARAARRDLNLPGAARQAVGNRRRHFHSVVAPRHSSARAVHARRRLALRIRHRVRVRRSDGRLPPQRQAGPARLSAHRTAVGAPRRRARPDGAAVAEEEARRVHREVVPRSHRGHAGRGLSSVRVAERFRDPARESPAPPDRAAVAAQRRRHGAGARRLEEGLALPRSRGVRVRARTGVLRPHSRGVGHPAGIASAVDRRTLVRVDSRHERRRQIVGGARGRAADADQARRDRRHHLLAARRVPAHRRPRRHLRRPRASAVERRRAAIARRGRHGRGRIRAGLAPVAAGGNRNGAQCARPRSPERQSERGQGERPPRARDRSDGGDVHARGHPAGAPRSVHRCHRCVCTQRTSVGHLYAAQRFLSAPRRAAEAHRAEGRRGSVRPDAAERERDRADDSPADARRRPALRGRSDDQRIPRRHAARCSRRAARDSAAAAVHSRRAVSASHRRWPAHAGRLSRLGRRGRLARAARRSCLPGSADRTCRPSCRKCSTRS